MTKDYWTGNAKTGSLFTGKQQDIIAGLQLEREPLADNPFHAAHIIVKLPNGRAILDQHFKTMEHALQGEWLLQHTLRELSNLKHYQLKEAE